MIMALLALALAQPAQAADVSPSERRARDTIAKSFAKTVFDPRDTNSRIVLEYLKADGHYNDVWIKIIDQPNINLIDHRKFTIYLQLGELRSISTAGEVSFKRVIHDVNLEGAYAVDHIMINCVSKKYYPLEVDIYKEDGTFLQEEDASVEQRAPQDPIQHRIPEVLLQTACKHLSAWGFR